MNGTAIRPTPATSPGSTEADAESGMQNAAAMLAIQVAILRMLDMVVPPLL
jgi:hypothetical protein